MRRTLLILIGLVTLSAPLQPVAAAGPLEPLAQVAGGALAALEARAEQQGPAFDPDRLLRFNLARYFVAYPVPEDGERERLVGTLERIVESFGRSLIEEASSRARASGAAAVEARQVAEVLGERLPFVSSGAFGLRRFFPHRPEHLQVDLELIDLEAFRDTGVPFRVARGLAADAELAGRAAPLAPEAVSVVLDGLSSYGLLVLRLAGEHARESYAYEVASPHLREAERSIRRRAGSEPVGPAPPGPAAADGLFVNATPESGIRFRHVTSDWLTRFRRYGPHTPTFSGGGVTAADLDGDRLPDLIYCGGLGCAVFLNRGDGTFEDVTAESGLNVAGEARMAIAADLDNDGDSDVFITYAYATNRLFENLGGGRFRDVTEASGLAREGDVSGPAVALDFDHDGLLDLYVANFGDYVTGEDPWSSPDARNAQPNRLYRNQGALRFTDVTERAGVGDVGWAQAVSAADLDGDGRVDIYVANDFGRNELYLNRGDGTFEAAAEARGADDRFHGMNVAFADVNRDGFADIMITNIWGWSPAREDPGELNTLLLSEPGEDGIRYRVGNPRSFVEADSGWSWAALFFDQDLDGDDDLFVVNGHSDYGVWFQYRRHPELPDRLYAINNGREPNLFYRNVGGELTAPLADTGAALAGESSRGLALLDYDADGVRDLAVSTFHSWGRLFRNEGGSGNWLVLELEGDPERGVSRDAIGAQVTVRGAGDLYVWRTVTAGEGYLGMSELPVHVGLGAAEEVEVEVRWPGGQVQRASAVPANRWVGIRQGEEGFRLLPRPGTEGE